ncbi:MAG: hypothetical protein WAW98_01065, partial [Trichococcus flocculiformis]
FFVVFGDVGFDFWGWGLLGGSETWILFSYSSFRPGLGSKTWILFSYSSFRPGLGSKTWILLSYSSFPATNSKYTRRHDYSKSPIKR